MVRYIINLKDNDTLEDSSFSTEATKTTQHALMRSLVERFSDFRTLIGGSGEVESRDMFPIGATLVRLKPCKLITT